MKHPLRPALNGLSAFLFILAILSGLVAVTGFLIGIVDGDPAGFMAAISGVGGVVTCLLGRVLIYATVMLEEVANGVRFQSQSAHTMN